MRPAPGAVPGLDRAEDEEQTAERCHRDPRTATARLARRTPASDPGPSAARHRPSRRGQLASITGRIRSTAEPRSSGGPQREAARLLSSRATEIAPLISAPSRGRRITQASTGKRAEGDAAEPEPTQHGERIELDPAAQQALLRLLDARRDQTAVPRDRAGK
jgi:hypothetical protein